MKKVKILQLIYKLEVGGAEKIVCALAERFSTDYWQCDVLSFKGGALEKQLAAKGVAVTVLHKQSGLDVSFLHRLYAHIRKNEYDIIHTHTFSPNMWGRIIGRLSGTPVIITTEHTVAGHKKRWQKAVDRVLSFASDRIVCVSNEVKKGMTLEVGLPDGKIEVIYNGVDSLSPKHRSMDHQRTLISSLGLTENLPILVSIGRLSEPKGYAYLLDAVALMHVKAPLGQFLIVGDGPLRADLERRAKRLNLGNSVHFCGFRNDIHDILQIADVVVSSSVREGFPVSLLEAMSAGKPIVATRVGGNKEAIESGRTGLLVPSRDPMALAAAIRYMLENQNFRMTCGKEALKEYHTRFTLDTMISRTEALYKKTLKAKPIN